MKRLLRTVALLMTAAMLLSVLAACKVGGGPTNESRTDADTEQNTTGDQNGGDPMNPTDIWDTDEPYTGVENDKALDTKGVAVDGSIFDSFQSAIFWSVRDVDKSYMSATCKDGILTMTAPATTLTNARYLQRAITTTFDSYEVEFKLRLGYAGWHNGFYIQQKNTRTMFHIYENKIRVNNPDDPGNSYKIYADIGTDWHVYRMVNYNGIASLYMDGSLLLTFEVNSYPASSAEMSFYVATGGSMEDGFLEVDYVSYKPLINKSLAIVSPTSRQTLNAGTTSVTVTCSVSDTLKNSGQPIRYYVNGVYAGETAATSPSLTLDGLQAGSYRLQVMCGDEMSEETYFSVSRARDEIPENSLLSTAQKLQSSYILTYTVNGDGTVKAGDGLFALDLKHTGSSLVYQTADGEKTVAAGSGAWIVSVDGGAAWIWYNGKPIASYAMPYTACGTTAVTTGAIADLTVSARNATLYRRDCSSGKAFSEELPSVPSSYALEFEYTKGKTAGIRFGDGAYLLSVDISEDGVARGYLSEQNVYYATLFEASAETAVYRIYVSAGLAQVYVNNRWLTSFALPTTVLGRSLSVSGSGLGVLQLREVGETYFLSLRADDADLSKWFTTDPFGFTTLKTYARNTEIAATVTGAASTGLFCLVARYDRGRGILAGYDYANGCFVMGTDPSSLTSVGKGTLASGDTLKLVVEDARAILYRNGTQVGTLSDPTLNGKTDTWYAGVTDVNGWGNVGYLCTANGVSAASYDYEGDGNPVKGATSQYLSSYHTVTVVELGETIWVCSGTGVPWRSEDGGFTFVESGTQDGMYGCVFNTLVLASGNVLTLVYKKETGGYINYAYVYKPDGKTLVGGPYKVQSEPLSYSQTQNGRVMQTSSGRIIFVVGECPNENTGGFTVYYTDREGFMWKKSKTPFTLDSTGFGLCEGDAVELEAGHLRLFARSELGFLYYSDSYDNGETWSMECKPSCFPSVSSCFGIEKDPETGALWMAWEYNNNNDNSTVQYPRSRTALAVSYDNGETWLWVGDMDEVNHLSSGTWVHMNLGLSVTSDAIWVTVAKRSTEEENVWYNYMVRIEKSEVLPTVRFNSLHVLRDPQENRPASDAVSLPLGGTLLISANTDQVRAGDRTFRIDSVDGKRTEVSAEMIAAFLGGTLTLDKDGTATIKVGNAEYVFTAGSDEALINGQSVKMSNAAVSRKGTVWVTVAALDEALGLTAQQTADGSIVLSIGKTLSDLEVLFVYAGI